MLSVISSVTYSEPAARSADFQAISGSPEIDVPGNDFLWAGRPRQRLNHSNFCLGLRFFAIFSGTALGQIATGVAVLAFRDATAGFHDHVQHCC